MCLSLAVLGFLEFLDKVLTVARSGCKLFLKNHFVFRFEEVQAGRVLKTCQYSVFRRCLNRTAFTQDHVPEP